MHKLTWSPRFAIGNALIDAEHQTLIRLYMVLHDAIFAGTTGMELWEHLFALTTHTEQHFLHEEGAMRDMGYPGLVRHTEVHKYLLRELADITLAHGDNIEQVSTKTLDYLNEWLLNHILGEDLLFGTWVRQQGLRDKGGS